MNNRQHHRVLGFASLFFLPLLANAHPGHSTASGWENGFMHPLQGADHLVATLFVGIWAAQQRGRAVWMIPTAFVGMMALGGGVGFTFPTLPGAETMIFLSLAVLVFLVARRIRASTWISTLLIGFFAFFHGFAHGAEMPAGGSPSAFGIGFLASTAFLQAVGWVGWRTAISIVLARGCAVRTARQVW